MKMISFYSNKVKCSRDHDDATGSLLPNHPPKITNGRFGGTLSYNVGLGLDQAIDI